MDINLIDFMPALLPIALSPGASFTLVMNSTLTEGYKGLLTTLTGTALGIYTHALLIGLGITTVLVSSPTAFSVLNILGYTYLLWLGVVLIYNGVGVKAGKITPPQRTITLKQAWLANVLNPKAIIFYLTVVSSFVGKQGGISHYLILATVHIVVMGSWLFAVSQTLLFSAKKVSLFMLKRYVNIAGGILLITYSVHSFVR